MTTSMCRCYGYCSSVEINQLPPCLIYLKHGMLRDGTLTELNWISPLNFFNESRHTPHKISQTQWAFENQKSFCTVRPHFTCWAPSHGGFNTRLRSWFKLTVNTLKHNWVLLKWQRWKWPIFRNILLTAWVLSSEDVPILKDGGDESFGPSRT